MSLLNPCRNCSKGFHEYCAVPAACDCDDCLKMEMEYCEDMIYLARTNDLNFDNGGEKMKVQKSPSFLKPDYVQEKGITQVTIVSEAEIVEGKFGPKLECSVMADGQKMIWGMNNTVKGHLIDAYGDETTNWLTKVIPIKVEKTSNDKSTIAIDEERFVIKKQEDIA